MICAVFCWFIGIIGVGFQIGIQFFFREGEFFAAVNVVQMKDGRKAFAVFVMDAVKAGTVDGLLHKITPCKFYIHLFLNLHNKSIYRL